MWGIDRWLSVFDQLCGVWTVDVLVTAVGVAAVVAAGVVAQVVFCGMEMPFVRVHGTWSLI